MFSVHLSRAETFILLNLSRYQCTTWCQQTLRGLSSEGWLVVHSVSDPQGNVPSPCPLSSVPVGADDQPLSFLRSGSLRRHVECPRSRSPLTLTPTASCTCQPRTRAPGGSSRVSALSLVTLSDSRGTGVCSSAAWMVSHSLAWGWNVWLRACLYSSVLCRCGTDAAEVI